MVLALTTCFMVPELRTRKKQVQIGFAYRRSSHIPGQLLKRLRGFPSLPFNVDLEDVYAQANA